MLTASRRWLQVEGVRTAQAASSDARLRYLRRQNADGGESVRSV